MRGAGWTTSGKAGATRGTRMAPLTLVTSQTTSPRGRAFTPGATARYTMGSGCRGRKRATVYGGAHRTANATSESGNKVRLMAMECTFGGMETNMRASGESA